MFIRYNGLVIGTLLVIGLVVAGIVASAEALTGARDRPSRGESQRSGLRSELEISRIDDYQGLRKAFIGSTNGRPR